jgi:hypothetical protein
MPPNKKKEPFGARTARPSREKKSICCMRKLQTEADLPVALNFKKFRNQSFKFQKKLKKNPGCRQ